jgi:hypothetical protein
MTNTVTITNFKDVFIFDDKYDKIILGQRDNNFILGFCTYINNISDMSNVKVEPYVIDVSKDPVNHVEVIELDEPFNICNVENPHRSKDRKRMKKVAFYNKYWKQYVSQYDITKRYVAYGAKNGEPVIIEFDSVEFLKGFQLAYAYQNSSVNEAIKIYRVHDNGQLCHQYITYNIEPNYDNASKIIHSALTDEELEPINMDLPEYYEIKGTLNSYMCTDVMTIILEYSLSVTCQYHNGCDEYRTKYNHCLTLCDADKYSFRKMCSVCSVMIQRDYQFQGKPFGISIRLEVATDS